MSNRNYGFSPYQNQNGNDGYQRRQFVQNGGNGYNARPQKKHSGAKFGVDKNGQPYVRGWKYDKRNGMRSFFASPYKGTGEHSSASGRVWYNWMVKISCEGRKPEIVSGLYDASTNKVVIKDLSFVMNPKASNGGYLGSFIKRKN